MALLGSGCVYMWAGFRVHAPILGIPLFEYQSIAGQHWRNDAVRYEISCLKRFKCRPSS
jgi:hypothetical protein